MLFKTIKEDPLLLFLVFIIFFLLGTIFGGVFFPNWSVLMYSPETDSQNLPSLVYLEPVDESIARQADLNLNSVHTYLQERGYVQPNLLTIYVAKDPKILATTAQQYFAPSNIDYESEWAGSLDGQTLTTYKKTVIVLDGSLFWSDRSHPIDRIEILTHELVHASQSHQSCASRMPPIFLIEGEAYLLGSLAFNQFGHGGEYPINDSSPRDFALDPAFQRHINEISLEAKQEIKTAFLTPDRLKKEDIETAEVFTYLLLTQSPGGKQNDIQAFHSYWQSFCSLFITNETAFVRSFGWSTNQAFKEYKLWLQKK